MDRPDLPPASSTTPRPRSRLDLPDAWPAPKVNTCRRLPPILVHNLIICTLCSCFPWPVWAAALLVQGSGFRSRQRVSHARCLPRLASNYRRHGDQGLDSTAIRVFVIPERPAGTDDYTDAALMDLVTTESMMASPWLACVMKLPRPVRPTKRRPSSNTSGSGGIRAGIGTIEFGHYDWSDFQQA